MAKYTAAEIEQSLDRIVASFVHFHEQEPRKPITSIDISEYDQEIREALHSDKLIESLSQRFENKGYVYMVPRDKNSVMIMDMSYAEQQLEQGKAVTLDPKDYAEFVENHPDPEEQKKLLTEMVTARRTEYPN